MQIFYCDDKILDLEKTENFKHLIKYLEAEAPLSEENFSAQIAYSWYLYCEGILLINMFPMNGNSIKINGSKKPELQSINTKTILKFPLLLLIA